MTAWSASRPGAAPSLSTWAAFGALCIGMFMAILDVQVVAASLPTIQTALAIQPEQMSWLQTSYLIAEVVAIPLTGLLTRALTMRWLSVAALVVFTAASMGCAWSGTLESLLAWRVVQGLAGGLLIPLVFAAGFVLFADRSQALATTIAGMLAVLAPTVGPFIGGWITDTYDWPWLFLVNIVPGVAAIATCASLLPQAKPELGLLYKLDPIALALMAIALASLEIGLKEAPQTGWLSFNTAVWLAVCVAAGSWFVARSLRAERPVVELRTLGDPSFALGCLLSFLLGIGLYGAVYLMPVFLAFVRNHEAMEIGRIMMVTGAAQLVMAPVAVALERHAGARWLTAAGFGLLAVGLAASAFQTRATDFDDMLLPQVIRGLAIMLCLLPPIRIALAHLPAEAVPDASGLFNLMRNLGGAIGLALIDTIIYGRAPIIGERLGQALERGDVEAAQAVGLPLDRFLAHAPGTPIEPAILAYVRRAVERQAIVEAVNEAWAMIALLALVGVVALGIACLRVRTDRHASQAEG
jgi:MFS transporter, DHA2 family, multidrug resistance protein